MNTPDFSTLRLRPICAADMPILLAIYASTRAAEMAMAQFSAEQEAAFLQMQFQAQHSHYQTHYPQAQFDCIVQGETVVGRLYVDRHPTEIRIMDISVLPDYCQQGIGRYFMQQLIAEAAQLGAKLTAHVEHGNPARAWYARLGFQEIEERGAYIFVAREPDRTTATNDELGARVKQIGVDQTNTFVENING